MKRSMIILLLFVVAATFTTSALFAKDASAMNLEKDQLTYNQYLIQALKDTNMGIRFSAAKLLGERKCAQAKEHLINVMKNDKQYQNRIVAGLALMEICDKDVLRHLKRQAEIDNSMTVRHVLRGIVQEMSKDKYLTMH